MKCKHLKEFQIKQDTLSHAHGIDLDKEIRPLQLTICSQCGKVISREEKKVELHGVH